MRSPQIVITVVFLFTTILTFISFQSSQSSRTSSNSASSGVHAFFSFQTPFSLFPPSALISLTHDNKTAFLARPAAFGPSLLSKGISGQVWIGSSFDDTASISELGCSDVQGWSTRYISSDFDSSNRKISADKPPKLSSGDQSAGRTRHEEGSHEISPAKWNRWLDILTLTRSATDDFTDDYLQHPPIASKLKQPNERKSAERNEDHSDIQSIQEGAEIAGKVVLLNRGGCGFLEKAKWSQRRGAIALIVGGSKKGGPLIQMFARGDTSSITIPSVFTSYTTANLLYTLATSRKSRMSEIEGEKSLKTNEYSRTTNLRKTFGKNLMSTSKNHREFENKNIEKQKKGGLRFDSTKSAIATKRPGWLSSIFTSSNTVDSKSDQSRPPRSGQLDWVLVEDWKAERGISSKIDLTNKATKGFNPEKLTKSERDKTIRNHEPKDVPDDNFVIGVQDWRDPDLVGNSKTGKFDHAIKKSSSSLNDLESEERKDDTIPLLTHKHSFGAYAATPEYSSSLKGGIITPSSGEYTVEYNEKNSKKEKLKTTENNRKLHVEVLTGGLDNDDGEVGDISQNKDYYEDQDNDQLDGLWVTLSASSGATPFLDTLLVLVVSPLVTLTIVYILLLIRSRYRQQKWRAPKSVVERLPVRTYQTMNYTGSNSPRLPNLSGLSVTSPLLQDISKPCSNSRMTNDLNESSGILRKSSQKQKRVNTRRDSGCKKIANKSSSCQNQVATQTECVVCLEEYIDGVSQIMALPCGHEFHVECITPWLTTRRRTCPMCKGDVVRSLARASQYDSLENENDRDEDYYHGQRSQSMTDTSPGIIINEQPRNDLELGRPFEVDHRVDASRTSIWRGLLMGNFMPVVRSVQSTREDRNR